MVQRLDGLGHRKLAVREPQNRHQSPSSLLSNAARALQSRQTACPVTIIPVEAISYHDDHDRCSLATLWDCRGWYRDLQPRRVFCVGYVRLCCLQQQEWSCSKMLTWRFNLGWILRPLGAKGNQPLGRKRNSLLTRYTYILLGIRVAKLLCLNTRRCMTIEKTRGRQSLGTPIYPHISIMSMRSNTATLH